MSMAENEIQIGDLLKKMTVACTDSAKQLHQAMSSEQWDESIPHVYTMPKMQVSVKMALSYSESTVKGVLFWKSKTGTEANTLSEIKIELVAVPRVE